jgi:hypothetical protein
MDRSVRIRINDLLARKKSPVVSWCHATMLAGWLCSLSRVSGVRQPSISQFLSGKVDLSDEQLDRLLSCMGYRLEVVRRPVTPDLTRSERRSWRLHRQLSSLLTKDSLKEWRPVIERNLQRLRGSVTGQPHSRNLDRWDSLVERGDVLGLHRVLTGLDRDFIEMREVSPMSGLLPHSERQAVLQEARWCDATSSSMRFALPARSSEGGK